MYVPHMAPSYLAAAIGRAVHSAIRESGLNLRAYGELSGTPHGTLSRRINGHSCFNYAELVQAADITGIELAEILDRAQRASLQKVAS